MNTPYDDIIGLEHPTSKKHRPMARRDRAAQFAPFAALTGYDDLIRESERDTDAPPVLDENELMHELEREQKAR